MSSHRLEIEVTNEAKWEAGSKGKHYNLVSALGSLFLIKGFGVVHTERKICVLKI